MSPPAPPPCCMPRRPVRERAPCCSSRMRAGCRGSARRRWPSCASVSPDRAGACRRCSTRSPPPTTSTSIRSPRSNYRRGRAARWPARRCRLLRLARLGSGTTLGLVTAYVTSAELARTPTTSGSAAARRGEPASVRPGQSELGPANLKRMVLPSERAVRSALRALRVLTALPLERLVLGAVARKLHRASAFDLPELVFATSR